MRLILLRAAAADPGLKMTATGNLSRGVVADMCDRFSWPEFDKAGAFQFHKVINEPDFLPLYFVRHIAQTGTLLRKHKGHLKISPAGTTNAPAAEPASATGSIVPYHNVAFRPRISRWGLHHGWPQRDAGIILWSLSIASNDWQPRERLSRMCTIPINGVLDQAWDTASFAMEAQILRPLQWFGLLEHREDETDLSLREGGISIARPRCSIASCHLTSRSRTQEDHDTDRVATLPTDRIPTAARGSDAADCQFASERPDLTHSSRSVPSVAMSAHAPI